MILILAENERLTNFQGAKHFRAPPYSPHSPSGITRTFFFGGGVI